MTMQPTAEINGTTDDAATDDGTAPRVLRLPGSGRRVIVALTVALTVALGGIATGAAAAGAGTDVGAPQQLRVAPKHLALAPKHLALAPKHLALAPKHLAPTAAPAPTGGTN